MSLTEDPELEIEPCTKLANFGMRNAKLQKGVVSGALESLAQILGLRISWGGRSSVDLQRLVVSCESELLLRCYGAFLDPKAMESSSSQPLYWRYCPRLVAQVRCNFSWFPASTERRSFSIFDVSCTAFEGRCASRNLHPGSSFDVVLFHLCRSRSRRSTGTTTSSSGGRATFPCRRRHVPFSNLET